LFNNVRGITVDNFIRDSFSVAVGNPAAAEGII